MCVLNFNICMLGSFQFPSLRGRTTLNLKVNSPSEMRCCVGPTQLLQLTVCNQVRVPLPSSFSVLFSFKDFPWATTAQHFRSVCLSVLIFHHGRLYGYIAFLFYFSITKTSTNTILLLSCFQRSSPPQSNQQPSL